MITGTPSIMGYTRRQTDRPICLRFKVFKMIYDIICHLQQLLFTVTRLMKALMVKSTLRSNLISLLKSNGIINYQQIFNKNIG